MKTPTFPRNETHATHCRAVLQCLLSGEKIDQFLYHARTGLPLVDYRTRISNLYLAHGWPIEREFHVTRDFNGEPRRVKRYWLNQSAMQGYYRRVPAFEARCALFVTEGAA